MNAAIKISIAALAVSLASLIISILNYRRDRPNVVFGVQFNMSSPSGPALTIVSIANIGRRPAFVSHVGLAPTRFWRFGMKKTAPTFLIPMSVQGETLQEGGKAWQHPMAQRGEAFDNLVRGRPYLRAFAFYGGKHVTSRAFKVPAKLHS